MREKRVKILGVEVDRITTKETVDIVREYVKEKKFLHLMGVNADKILICHNDIEMKNIVNSCEVINADGFSVVLASKYLNRKVPERVAGIDLMQSLIKDAEENGKTVYFLGAKQEILEKMIQNFGEKYPKLNVSGYRNGYFKENEWDEVSKELERKSPDYIFVGITSPLKEHLIEHFRKNGNKGVFMGVGGSFDVLSGVIPRAPKWMQKTGLEWLFRIIQEPRRLFKRYLIGNIRFIMLVINEKKMS